MAIHNLMGEAAEDAVARYLIKNGYKILDRNWKNRWAEIDIIAVQGSRVHFVEVKYRSSSEQGSGLDYITRTKLKQMSFAAEMWMSANENFEEYVLSAAEVIGTNLAVEFIDEI